MTRINCIDPDLLQDKHLLAEYRELPRIFGLIRKAQERGETPSNSQIPKAYRMGPGHVRFFYNKALWLVMRQESLIAECVRRGFNIQYRDTGHLLDGINEEWCGTWYPTSMDQGINIARINDRGGLRDTGRSGKN
jgi:deoxyribonuclease (pyrimidine dimer)